MDLEVRRAPVGADLRADPAAIEALIDDQTMMIVGSAPSFPYGCIDPIADARRTRAASRICGCTSMPASAAISPRS